ncbi:MAG: hypothetical protein AB9907_11060 [Flexilinea sp.]
MTAVNLLQLRKQINGLLWTFMDPEAFRINLKQLIDQYTNLSYKPGKGAVTSIQSSELHVPPLVQRELELELYQTVREHPQSALNLCDHLWLDPNPEMKIVASRMLGNIPIEFLDEILLRIEKWAKGQPETYSEKVFLQNASVTIRRNEPDRLMSKAREWCGNESVKDQSIGLHLLIILADDPVYINLPAIFKSLEKILLNTPAVLQSDIVDLLMILLDRSPIETSFFIRRNLENSPSKSVIRASRKLLPYFPEASKPVIEVLLRKAPNK